MRTLSEEGVMKESFNTGLFTFGASSRPETSGLGVALVGSLYMMLIVLGLSCRSVLLLRSIWKSSPRRTASPT